MIQRNPAKERKISEITDERRVRLYGTVIGKEPSNGLITIDDGTGRVNVFFDDLTIVETLEGFADGEQVLVVGSVVPKPEGIEISGELIKRVQSSPSLSELRARVNHIWAEVEK